jgi:hypothetical protein
MPKSAQIHPDLWTKEEKERVAAGGPIPTENSRLSDLKNVTVVRELKTLTDEAAATPDKNIIEQGISLYKQTFASLMGAGATPQKTKEQLEAEELEKADKLRINHQAYLMFMWETLTAESKNNTSRFKSFAQIDHPNPAELNNILFKRPPIFDILLNSKSADLSYFVPKVRLFKQHAVSATETVDIELPIAEGYKDEDFYSIYLDKKGRGGGVGLKAFNWNTIGNSPGNQFSFGAEIELFFESISEISKIRSVDVIGGKTYETSFADLLILKKSPGFKAEGAVYDPDYYRIKAEIGWHIPRGKLHPVDADMIKELEASNLSLYLGLVSHEIDIADDSSVTLKIKYIAYIEALTDHPRNSNIFYPEDEKYEEVIAAQRAIIQEKAKILTGDAEKNIEAATGTVETNTKKDIENIEKDIEKKQSSNKLQVYSRILNYIYNKSGALRYTTVNQEVFNSFTDIIAKPKAQMSTEAQITSYMSSIESIRNNNKKLGAGGSATLNTDSLVASAAAPATQEELVKSIASSIEASNALLSKAATDGSVVIPYFYVGDLIEAIMTDMYNGGPAKVDFLQKQMKLLLGPMVFYDYGRLVDNIAMKPQGLSSKNSSGNKIPLKIYTGTKTVVNIADIPISLDTYGAWFNKKIVDAGVVNMSIREFINSIINDLVIRSVGVDTYSFAPRQRVRLVYKTKTLRSNKNRFSGAETNGTKPGSFSQAVSSGNTGVPVSLRFDAKSLKLFDENITIQEKSSLDNFILIYATSDQAFELISDYDADIKKGIRHIVYGAETGLIKNIKFTRQDNPLIRSHNMRLASSENGDKGVILREVYNANVEMYGNSLFEIGELLYVSPSLFGTADSIDFVKDLGIGGYFMILKINNSIADGSFKTSLDLKWNAKGDGLPNNLNDGKEKSPTDLGVKII